MRNECLYLSTLIEEHFSQYILFFVNIDRTCLHVHLCETYLMCFQGSV